MANPIPCDYCQQNEQDVILTSRHDPARPISSCLGCFPEAIQDLAAHIAEILQPKAEEEPRETPQTEEAEPADNPVVQFPQKEEEAAPEAQPDSPSETPQEQQPTANAG